jgi:hypothetical protein
MIGAQRPHIHVERRFCYASCPHLSHEGQAGGFGKKIGEVVYQTMVDTINVPANDNFQLITEHDSNTLIYDPSYLSIPRTDGIVIVQITLNEGRTVELKKAFLHSAGSEGECRAWHPGGGYLRESRRSEEGELVVWQRSRTVRSIGSRVERTSRHKGGNVVPLWSPGGNARLCPVAHRRVPPSSSIMHRTSRRTFSCNLACSIFPGGVMCW